MDLDQCACSGKTLGRLVQPALMAVLAAKPLHGYLLVQELGGLAMFRCQPPDPTGVYRVLRSMEADGLVVSEWDLGDTGPARRKFTLTGNGRACLARWADTLAEYAAAINDLLVAIDGTGGGPRSAAARRKRGA